MESFRKGHHLHVFGLSNYDFKKTIELNSFRILKIARFIYLIKTKKYLNF